MFDHDLRILSVEQAVVGHENQAAGGVIEIANGIDALRKSPKKIAKSLAAGRIGEEERPRAVCA